MPTKVLLVEDNPPNLELMVYLLKAFGYETRTATDGDQGMAAVRAERPDLMLCDIQMPGRDGFSVIQEMKTDPVLAQIPVIAVTAFAMVGDQDRILAAGFDGCLVKPIDPERFVEQVEAFLSGERRKGKVATDDGSTQQRSAQIARRAASILVVDDVPNNLLLARSLLEPFGYEVLTASGGREAMELLTRRRPDLIVSDVCMDGGTGYDLLRSLKTAASLAEIPFIFLTSTMVGEKHRSQGLSLGADRYIFRPIDPETLLKEIRACLGSRADRVENPRSIQAVHG